MAKKAKITKKELKELKEPGFLKKEYLETELSLESTLDGAVRDDEMDERVQDIELEHLGGRKRAKKQ